MFNNIIIGLLYATSIARVHPGDSIPQVVFMACINCVVLMFANKILIHSFIHPYFFYIAQW